MGTIVTKEQVSQEIARLEALRGREQTKIWAAQQAIDRSNEEYKRLAGLIAGLTHFKNALGVSEAADTYDYPDSPDGSRALSASANIEDEEGCYLEAEPPS